MTMNDTWGFKKDDHNWKSTDDLIHKLVDIVSKGGNFLLNVGPTAEGEIPQPSVERLDEIGRVDGRQRREHLRHHGQPVQAACPGAAARRSRASSTCTCSTGPTTASWSCPDCRTT